MKIGILTFHRAYNYGAVLQCYALQQFLKSMGHDVEVIDYRQPWIEAGYKSFSIRVLMSYVAHPKAFLRYIYYFFRRRRIMKTRKLHFRSFLSDYIRLSPNPVYQIGEIPQNYDAYIIGSDQLWGKGCMGGKLDDVYLGRFAHTKESKIIGYAISSTGDSINKLYKENRLTDSLKQFYALSFRESSISRYIQNFTNISYPVTIDPTLLSDESLWKPLINDKWNKKNYVVIYQLRGGKELKSFLYKKAYQIAQQFEECSIINLTNLSYPVDDFLSIIKYAKFVVTSSFHATVFSIIFKTPFYAVKLNDGKDHRYVDLCVALGLEKQCIDMNNSVFNKDVDFSNVDMRLVALRQQSVSFVIDNLE